MQSIISRFSAILETWPDALRKIPQSALESKPAKDKWSGKEILGHLIDSAANNHQRFVRLQYEETVISYDQARWVAICRYQEASTEDLITLWESYNRHLLHIIKAAYGQMPLLEPSARQSLEFFMEDYVRHLEHHLRQIDPYFTG